VTLCVVLPLGAFTLLSNRIATHLLQSELEKGAQKILNETNNLVQNKIDPIFSYGFLAISNPVLPMAIRTKNGKILESVSSSIRKGLNLEIVEVIDGSGKIVYSEENPEQVGFNRLESHFIQRILLNYAEKRSLSTVGIEKRVQGLAIQIATVLPGEVGGSLPGMMLMGFYLDDNFFRGIQAIIDGEFVLFSKNEVYASTLPRKDPVLDLVRGWTDKEWDALQEGQRILPELGWFNTHYVGAFTKMKPDVGHLYLGVLVSKEKVLEVQKQTKKYIVLSGSGGILLALCLSLFFSGRLIAPLKRLTVVIEKVMSGDVNARAEDTSNDEVGFLARTFNAMMNQIKDAEDRLVRSERLAAIGQLASGVGHELRNPLAAIKNAIYYIRSVVKKDPHLQTNEPVQRMMDIADNEIDATVKISNDLLEFSRMMRINPMKISIYSVLDSVFTVISIPSSINLERNFAPDLPTINADPERLRQVFINLVQNGIDAMPEGGTLEIQTSHEDGTAQVSVRDTGCGIKEEDLKKIFEPLFSTKPKGTGLGLAIVQGIIEAHKATIAVKSTVGQGTEFTLRFPAT